jgi:septal ring factor EnvC (AmiA/AmiB activator)
VSHGEFKRHTAYCHLQDVLVSVGEEVARGRIIGRMGVSGKALGVSQKAYPLGRLALTYPIPCGGAYRER